MKENLLFKKDKDQVIIKAMELFSLPPVAKVFIDNLLSGKVDESLLVCCHSECSICQQTVYDCLQEIKKQLAE